MSDLCIVCTTSVSGRKHAVTCDVCERWQHRLCDTGITLADYRAAVKNEKELHFVCRDCSNSIPLLDPEDDVESMDEAEPSSMGVPVAESTLALWDEMNVLQVSVPLDETTATDDDLQPPVLERSAPPSDDSVPSLNDSILLPPVLEISAPFSNSTVDDGDDYDASVSQQHDDTVLGNATYVVTRDEEPMDETERSFDISNRVVNDTPPIQEEPVVEEPMLTETVIEDRPLTFTVVEKGSQRGRQLLVDSNGYSYGVKARYTSSVTWRCSVRTSAVKCPVTVKQVGDDFTMGAVQHIHPADAGRLVKAEVSAKGQLFSIHAFVEKDGKSQQFPLAFVIMSRKTIGDYNEVFRVLLEKLGQVEVEGFVVDFEAAAWRALRDSFPGKPIKGCVFHWNQAVWRHVQQFGLAATYQQREGVYDYVRQLMALPFLPARHIPPTFQHLKTKASSEPLKRLVNYIERQWFNHPVFDVPSWSVFQQTVRTNNDVEGWHHRLNSKAGMSGLGFYRLVPLLKREATLMEMALRGGDLQRDNRGMYRRLETRLQENWAKYLEHEMSTTAFLKACGSLYGVRLSTPTESTPTESD